MPFSVADIKERATHAKNASVTKFQDTRDRYSSTPMAQSKFINPDGTAPSKGQPPPPPPPRSTSSASASSAASHGTPRSAAFARSPPPLVRTNKPSAKSSNTPQHDDVDHIDWANLSPEDKQVFFSWLDEFFERFLGVPISSNARHTRPAQKSMKAHAPYPAPRMTPSAPSPARGPPPPVATWSRPSASPVSGGHYRPINSTADSSLVSDDFVMSHPPASVHGSLALDFAQFFLPESLWDYAWYDSPAPLPPPLEGNRDVQWAASMMSRGSEKTVSGGVLFADLSICWFQVTAPVNADPAYAERHAEYLPRPSPLSKEALVDAHETYGDTIALFAESFVGTGKFCARGECWDLASEALKYFSDFNYVPAPIASMSRTHGHLIFEGKALGKNRQVGRWRGGDDRVRRGDIVEWRKVKINTVGARFGSYAILGDPDHTAVITADSVPSRSPVDSQSLLPSELVSLEVVEQSVGDPPKKTIYDMSAFEEGEVWIYRPVGMEAYLGVTFGGTPGQANTIKFL